ncbi:MAG: TrmB family transcriptional regulator [Asgard group archaeon]|nr:TrmB family transcriptional regulator [Asgard group archaeon]
MSRSIYSEIEIEKFLREVLKSELAFNVYKQLVEDGGNTALGISENLRTKGKKASKTRVYEEISTLLKHGLIKRVSNRPPIYTTIPSQENFERIARLFFMDTREELMRRWAATYPFLPEEMRLSTESKTLKLQTGPIVSFSPYPVVDVFQVDNIEDLRKYILRVFESPVIYISQGSVDTCFRIDQFRKAFAELKFEPLIKQMKENYERSGEISFRSLSSYNIDDLKETIKTSSSNKLQQQFFRYMDYEVREPKERISSFILGKNYLLYPIGIGGANSKTFVIIEIRDPSIIKIAQESFETSWQSAKVILAVKKGKVI